MKMNEREKKNKLDKTIDGYKVRWQFFNLLLCCELYLIFMVFCLFGVNALITASFNKYIQEVSESIPLILMITVPLALLSFINYFIGPVVCILTDDGIHHKSGFIRWKEISKIEYNIELPSRYRCDCNKIEIFVKDEAIEIDHAPLYTLFKIKRMQPQIKMDIAKWDKIFLIIIAVLPFVVGAILPLISD